MTNPKPELKRLKRATLSTRIAAEMREAILSGTFGSGAQLNEMMLAEQFGVSRGPVREAIQRLIQEGLLYNEPHRGVFVPTLTEDDLNDIYFVREAIEGAAIRRLMASSRREAIRDALLTMTDRMEAAVLRQDWPLVAETDVSFHRRLVEAADSFRLSRVYETVIAETKLCLHMLMGGYREHEAVVQEHRRLAECVGGNDVTATLVEFSRHLGDPIRTLHAANAAREKRDQNGRGALKRAANF